MPEEELELLSSMLSGLTFTLSIRITNAEESLSIKLAGIEERAKNFRFRLCYTLDLLESKLRESVSREREIAGVIASLLPMLEKDYWITMWLEHGSQAKPNQKI